MQGGSNLLINVTKNEVFKVYKIEVQDSIFLGSGATHPESQRSGGRGRQFSVS